MRTRWLALALVSALVVVVVRACQPAAPAVAPVPPARVATSCPCPGPLAADIAALRDREAQVATLGRLHARARSGPLSVALGEALACADPALRSGILAAIESEGSELDRAMPAVARLIDDADGTTRTAAVAAATRIGIDSPAGDATRALLARLARVEHADRVEALALLAALARIRVTPQAFPRLLAALRDRDVEPRRLAADALWSIANDRAAELPETALEVLVAASTDPDELVRVRAIGALGNLRDSRAVRILAGKLASSTRDRGVVVDALGTSGPLARDQQHALAAIVKSADEPMELRTSAAQALGAVDADAPAAYDALLAALMLPQEYLIESMRSDGREELRRAASAALTAVMRTHPAAVRAVAARRPNEHVLDLLCGEHHARLVASVLVAQAPGNERIGGSIAGCLGDDAPLAIGALPALIAYTRSTDSYTRSDAATGLGAIRSPGAVQPLVEQLVRAHAPRDSADWREAEREGLDVLHALARIGPAGRPYRAAIATWFDRPVVRPAAAVALIATEVDVAAGIHELTAGLASTVADERAFAARELAAIITDDAVADLRPVLAARMADPEWHVREAATIAIGKLGPRAAPFLQAIRDQLPVYHSYMEWQAAADALVALGPAAAPALPELIAAIRERSDAWTLAPALASIVRTTPGAADRLRAAVADDGYPVRSLADHAIELAKRPPEATPARQSSKS